MESEKEGKAQAEANAQAMKKNWRDGQWSEVDRALCEWAEKLTLRPAECNAKDVEALRAHGFNDQAIHDAAQAISYFNYINRIADGLGVDLEPEMASENPEDYGFHLPD